jgi:hypothetical protein
MKTPFRLSLLAVVAVACLALPADAAQPKKGARYLAKIPPTDTRDPTIRLKVSGNGKTLDLTGPHERCGTGSGGFNPLPPTYPKINRVAIGKTGKFSRSRKYEVQASSIVTFTWTAKVTGRFVSKDKATGKLVWHLRVGGERSQGKVTSCGESSAKFTAKRGAKHPGLLPG